MQAGGAGAPADSDTVPAKFSAKNAADDKLITVAYTFKKWTDEQRRAIYQALKDQPDRRSTRTSAPTATGGRPARRRAARGHRARRRRPSAISTPWPTGCCWSAADPDRGGRVSRPGMKRAKVVDHRNVTSLLAIA
jgi:hypothetical protein